MSDLNELMLRIDEEIEAGRIPKPKNIDVVVAYQRQQRANAAKGVKAKKFSEAPKGLTLDKLGLLDTPVKAAQVVRRKV